MGFNTWRSAHGCDSTTLRTVFKKLLCVSHRDMKQNCGYKLEHLRQAFHWVTMFSEKTKTAELQLLCLDVRTK